MITIDGSYGEGGGQVLRTSLALSLVTGRAFSIQNIRAGRKKPGLLRQHLTAANAAGEVGRAEIKGNEIGSLELFFAPTTVRPGRYRFAVGTAGSCTLVLQTVLPALILAESPSDLVLEGGTHNPHAPPFDFLEYTFLPIVNSLGPRVTARLEVPGFYPAGGGRFAVTFKPAQSLRHIDLTNRGRMINRRARAAVSRLPISIAHRELKVVKSELSWTKSDLEAEEIRDARGPGNILTIVLEFENVTEVFSGFGQRGVQAEKIAERTARLAKEYLEADVPVGKHLADQLLIPMALAGGGRFLTLEPTEHTRTNMEIIKRFIDVDIQIVQQSKRIFEIIVQRISK